MIHRAFVNPPMSWLRKMSAKTRNRIMIQMTKRKNHSIVMNTPIRG